MKKAIITELIWLAGILVAAFLLTEFLLGNSALDINLHDIYIYENGQRYLHQSGRQYLSLTNYPFIYFIVITFWVYLIRATYGSFKVIIINIIFGIITGTFLYFCDSIIVLYPLHIINSSPHYYNLTTEPIFNRYYYSPGYYLIINAVKIILTLLFGFAAYMIGRNQGKASKT